jgi:hypothetical protein
MHLVPNPQTVEHVGRLAAAGRWPHQQVWACCDCGWTAAHRRLDRHSHQLTLADLAGHLREDAYPDNTEGHQACGHHHQLHDDCPIHPDSPAGLVCRAATSSRGDPNRAADRITAITALRAWLDDQEPQALIGAALNGLTWNQISHAAGLTLDQARHRWGDQLDRYHRAGILPAVEMAIDIHPTDAGL